MWWLLVPATYLLGSVSFAWLAGRAKGIDLREHGSRNLGATNAGRVLGGRWFAIVFSADVLKGLLPVLAAVHLAPPDAWLPMATAAAAVLGHVFTCFHGLRGGKAVATSLGVLIGLLWLVAVATAGVWLVVWCAGWIGWRAGRAAAVGPASIAASLAVPGLYTWLTPQAWSGANIAVGGFVCLLAAVVVIRHRANILRLLGRSA
jgi:acyl phosphate:glycerol-3-phosphate acyltransferase